MILSNSDPYEHFNTPGRRCFNKLFYQLSSEEEDIENDTDDDDDYLNI